MKWEFDFTELNKFADRLVEVDEFEARMKSATRRLSKALLKWIKEFTPVDYYKLLHAWDKNKFLVNKTDKGFEVLLVNNMQYATWVNDGHKQKPGRFIPGYWENATHFRYDPNAKGGMVLKKSWVKGVFFVEKGILRIANTEEIEQIIMDELQKWWDSV